MNLSNETKIVLTLMANKYLEQNPERFNMQEKEQFKKYLTEFLNSNNTQQGIRDEIYDFLVFTNLYNIKPRHEAFAKHVINKYSKLNSKRALDVGAGRTCKLAKPLTDAGFCYSAIDPQIRLTELEAKTLGIKSIKKDLFFCKEFSPSNKETDVNNCDLLIAQEPCLGAEHIIRLGLEKEIPFEILLCYENHPALSGKTFRTPEEWYTYLQSISSEVKIERLSDGFHASRNEREI